MTTTNQGGTKNTNTSPTLINTTKTPSKNTIQPTPPPMTNTTTPPTSSPSSPYPSTASVAITAFVFLAALVFLAFFSIYARRRLFSRPARLTFLPSTSSAPRGLDPRTINTLPITSYKNSTKWCNNNTCVVCLGEFGGGEVVKVIPCCGHVFHPKCIDSWLVGRGSCPLCRKTEIFESSSSLEEGWEIVEKESCRL